MNKLTLHFAHLGVACIVYFYCVCPVYSNKSQRSQTTVLVIYLIAKGQRTEVEHKTKWTRHPRVW